MTVFWDWLRMTRSDPPGAAIGDLRAADTYRSSMEQFEELIRAAATVGYAARPLPLFYALSQAGRAIVAARGGAEHQTHGLTLDRNIPADVLEAKVGPQAGGKAAGQFETVAASIASAAIGQPVQLGALIHSLPEISIELARSTDWPKALPLFLRHAGPVRSPSQTPISLVIEEERVGEKDLALLLKPYPNAKQIGVNPLVAQSFPTLPTSVTPKGPGVDVIWIGDEADLDSKVPQYRYRGWRWIRPALVDAQPPPSALMTWWLLLFGLSMLARYHPVPWTRALDVDSSPVAVTLELTMNRAIDALPHLVFEAVMNVSITLPARDSYDPFA
jgi:hypothetical protein